MPSSAPYRSRARAYVELYNGILTRAIKSLSSAERESWADKIPVITFLLNNKLFLIKIKLFFKAFSFYNPTQVLGT